MSRERNQIRDLLVSLSQHLKTLTDSGRVSLFYVYESTLSKIASIDLVAADGLVLDFALFGLRRASPPPGTFLG